MVGAKVHGAFDVLTFTNVSVLALLLTSSFIAEADKPCYKCKSTEVCCSGWCVVGSVCFGLYCSDDSDCLSQERCCDNICVNGTNCVGQNCSYYSDCGSGEICCTWKCKSGDSCIGVPCQVDSNCADGETCCGECASYNCHALINTLWIIGIPIAFILSICVCIGICLLKSKCIEFYDRIKARWTSAGVLRHARQRETTAQGTTSHLDRSSPNATGQTDQDYIPATPRNEAEEILVVELSDLPTPRASDQTEITEQNDYNNLGQSPSTHDQISPSHSDSPPSYEQITSVGANQPPPPPPGAPPPYDQCFPNLSDSPPPYEQIVSIEANRFLIPSHGASVQRESVSAAEPTPSPHIEPSELPPSPETIIYL